MDGAAAGYCRTLRPRLWNVRGRERPVRLNMSTGHRSVDERGRDHVDKYRVELLFYGVALDRGPKIDRRPRSPKGLVGGHPEHRRSMVYVRAMAWNYLGLGSVQLAVALRVGTYPGSAGGGLPGIAGESSVALRWTRPAFTGIGPWWATRYNLRVRHRPAGNGHLDHRDVVPRDRDQQRRPLPRPCDRLATMRRSATRPSRPRPMPHRSGVRSVRRGCYR